MRTGLPVHPGLSPDKLGLVAAGAGAPGPQQEADQDDHQDQHGNDGQEDPHQGGHLDGLDSENNGENIAFPLFYDI